MSEDNELPKGWCNVQLFQISQLINGDRGKNYPSREAFAEVGVPFVNAGHLHRGIINFDEMNFITEERFALLGSGKFFEGDILYCLRGSLGKAAIVRANENGAIASSLVIIRCDVQVEHKFLYYCLVSPHGERQISLYDNGTAQPNLSGKNVNNFRLPIAPLNEQRRIVAKIEELFSDLDAGVAALKRAKANLKRYRAAVLKAAVEGKLTEEWRTKHPNIEPASKLLERILTERRKKWEADQLAKFAAADREPPKNWRDKYVEPTPPDMTGIPELPIGWTVASVDQLTTTITSGSRDWTQYYGSGSGTFIMAQNVRKGLLDLEYRQPVNPPPNDRDSVRSQIACNDLLVTIVGANTGDVCRVPTDLPEHYVCQSVALMRPVIADVAMFLEAYFIADHGGQKHFERYIYGQGRPHLGFDELRMTPVVLPPLDEQTQIVAEVAELLSEVGATVVAIDHDLVRANHLRQSILKQAFEGKLLPQDPKDEPANVLLERIRASGSPGKQNDIALKAAHTKSKRVASNALQ